MRLQHLPNGRTVGDTQLLAALSGRSVAAVRRHCTRGEHGYDVEKCLTTLAGAHDPVVLTARQAERYLAIPAGTVRAWAHRGKLRPLDYTPTGYPLYDATDLLRLREGDDDDRRAG